MSAEKRVLPELDGVRGTAFLLVLIGHIFSNNPHILPSIVGVPKFGVWMFFVLSSFLLTNYFLAKPERVQKPIEWGNYLVRRFMRIYPLYALVLLAYWLWHRDIQSLDVVVDHLLLRKGYIHLWTMPAEITFYLFLPFIVAAIVWICRMNVIFSLVFLAVFVAIHQIFFPFTSAVENSVLVFQYLPVFIYGSVSSLIHQRLKQRNISKGMQVFFDAVAITTVVVLLFVTPYPMKHIFGYVAPGYLMNKYLFIGAACSVILLSILHGRVVKQFFAHPVMRFFGKISYGGYLIHWMFIQMVIAEYFKRLTIVSGLVTFSITILAAVVLHYLVERPCIKVNLLKTKRENPIPLTAQ